MNQPLAIVRVAACSPVGLDARHTAASLRARISRKTETMLLDRANEPVVIGHLGAGLLPPIVAALRPCKAASPLEGRLLRLGGYALQDLLSDAFAKLAPPLLLALPDGVAVSHEFVARLATQAGRSLASGRVFAHGHTGCFAALQAARDELLGSGRAEFAIVGGVDSYLDEQRVAALERDGRLRTSGPQDAFTPGEAAAFVLLASEATCRRYGLTPLGWITAIAEAEPSERLDSTLARACTAALDHPRGNPPTPIAAVMAGLNGESRPARAWGVAHVRNREHFAAGLRIDHPAEFIGDCGAALAPIMLTTAALHMQANLQPSPTLVWACSDAGHAGALVLYAAR